MSLGLWWGDAGWINPRRLQDPTEYGRAVVKDFGMRAVINWSIFPFNCSDE